jgi:phospholipase/lecithinase/hemolysin
MLGLFGRALPVLAVVALFFVDAPASASPFTSMVVFGDSLSDSGNNAIAIGKDPGQLVGSNFYVPTYPYASGVYSNGPVWASNAAAALNVPLLPSLAGGTNYAFGGATTGTPGGGPDGFPYSLLQQAGQYLAAVNNHASPTALYVVEGGGNNARATLAAIAALPQGTDPTQTIVSAAQAYANDIKTIVDGLNAVGAKHIIVWNTPNIGLAPAVHSLGLQAAGLGSLLASTMNQALAFELKSVADVTMFDIYGLGTAIAANPAAYGFTDAFDACGAAPSGTDCNKYVYWDGIHPTAAAHRVIADAFVASAVPEPSTWALALIGVGVIGFVAYRRRTPRPAEA